MEKMMRTLWSLCLACAAFVFFALGSSTASAFCSTYQQTLTGFSRPDVVLRLNDLQSREVRRLRQRHGDVDLDAVDISCSGSNPVRCTLTQGYCVANSSPEVDDCPGDSVRDRRGRCVKEAEPETCPRGTVLDRRGRCVREVQDDDCPGDSVRDRRGRCVKEDEPPPQANPCSGGRLFSQSLEICHCPEQSPVWTGQRCVRANINDGASNNQIIQRCRRLEQECQTGVLRGACRALRTYCDRG
jgi:hypothetical protein